jgi:uncharacterized protein YbjT (DUF2867 family)|tara:strand:- start:281 stop:511 length:231 start_codon:yes stop_codon:yes gene_type:complete
VRIEGLKLVVIGGAGLIGSHTVDELLNEDVSFVRNRIGDPTAAKFGLDFAARTDLVEGLRELFDWRSDHRRRLTGG